MTEQKWNKKVQELVEANGGYIVKTISSNKAGVSDMLACINGRFCSIEGKLSYNKMSKLQIAHHRKTIQAGGLCIEAKTLDDVLLIIHWANTGYKQQLEDIKQIKSFTI